MAHAIELISEDGKALASGALAQRGELTGMLERRAVLALVVLAAFGFGLRLSSISSVGFAEDEINKLEAVRAYARGDITPNAEHPMLMKALIFASMQAAQVWNAADAGVRISDEAALRFPNVLFGTLTVLPLFLLTTAFFDRRTALVAAALWSFGINAITYNRIAKEDTLLVFFMLLAFYLYVRAKQTSGHDPQRKRRFYILSGASFGLMLASKYFPHYLGLNMLYYHLVRVRERAPDEPRGKTPPVFYIVLLAVFLVANPALLMPQTWQYLSVYSSEGLLSHHGYLMGDSLYANQMSRTPFGTPIYFYVLFLLIKTPLPLLFVLGIGLVEIVRHRREPGHAFLLLMFLLWIVPYSLVGAKWPRYTLSLMPFVYMIGAVGIVAFLQWLAVHLRGARGGGGLSSPARIASASALFVFIAVPAWIAYASRPHYALYTNALAARHAGYFFPHDEFYDDGLREAIRFVCENAPPGALIVHETPGVVRYYLEKYGRTDLGSRVLSDPQFDVRLTRPPVYVILQRGRTYFENREKMEIVRTKFRRVYEGLVRGATAAEVYVGP